MQKKSYGYGLQGWILIVACIFIMYCAASCQNSSLNVVVPEFVARFSWDQATLMLFSSYSGFITAGICVIFSLLAAKGGNGKKITIVSLVMTVIGMALWGRASTLWQYFLFVILMFVGTTGCNFYGLPILIGNWFPKKKGVVMGLVTVGNNLASLATTWVLTGLWAAFGFANGFTAWSVLAIVPIILIGAFIKEMPEQQGCFPDNDKSMTMENLHALQAQAKRIEETSPFTVKSILKMKRTWALVVGCGILMMATMGIVTQVVPSFLSRGYERTMAMLMMSVVGGIAIPSSIFLGWLDTKFGTKLACIVCACVSVVGIFFMALPFGWSVIPGMIGVGFLLGTSNNVFNSLLISIFGRYDFQKALSATQPIYTIIRAIGVALVAILASKTGAYTVPYIVLMILSVVSIVIFIKMDSSCVGRTDADIAILSKE